MKRFLAYLKYLFIHKYYVFKVGFDMNLSIWQLLKHDLSKFHPKEFITYSYSYFDSNGDSNFTQHNKLNEAWNRHQKRNKHHWQYWVLLNDTENPTLLNIPDNYIKEMAADMIAFDLAGTTNDNALVYFNKVKPIIMMNERDKSYLECLIITYGEYDEQTTNRCHN